MAKSNIWDDPLFLQMLNFLTDQADGASGPFIDGRLLRSFLSEGLKHAAGFEVDTTAELRAFTEYGRGTQSYVSSLDTGFRFDLDSLDVDDDTTVIKPTDIPLTAPGRWLSTWSGSGVVGPTFTNLTPAPVTHGGVSAGDTFLNQTMEQMFNKILYPYQAPAFSAFSISGQANPLEVGDQIPAAVTFLWATTNPLNVVANSLALRDVTNAVDLATGLADDGSEAVVMAGPIQKTSQASHVFRVTGTNTQAALFTRDSTYTWYWRVFAGTNLNATLTEPQIEALSDYNALTGSFARTYSLGAGGYKYVCYPSTLGWATDWRDQSTGFNVPFTNVGTVNVTNTFGQTVGYNVQRSTNVLGGAVNIIVS